MCAPDLATSRKEVISRPTRDVAASLAGRALGNVQEAGFSLRTRTMWRWRQGATRRYGHSLIFPLGGIADGSEKK